MQYRFSVQHLQYQYHTIDRSEELKARIKNNYMEDKSSKYIPPPTSWIHMKDDNGLKILAEIVQQVYSAVVVVSVNRLVRTLNGHFKCINGSWDKVVSKSMLRKICSDCGPEKFKQTVTWVCGV